MSITAWGRPLYSILVLAMILEACAPGAVEPTQSSTPQMTSTPITVSYTLTPEISSTATVIAQPTSTPPRIEATSTIEYKPIVTPFCAETIYAENFKPQSIFGDKTSGDVNRYIKEDPSVGYRMMLKFGGNLIMDKWPMQATDESVIGYVYLSFLGHFLTEYGPRAVLVPLITRFPNGDMVSFGNGSFRNMTTDEALAQAQMTADYLIQTEQWQTGSTILTTIYLSSKFMKRYNGDRNSPNTLLIDSFYAGKKELFDLTINGNTDAQNCTITPWMINSVPLPPDIAEELGIG